MNFKTIIKACLIISIGLSFSSFYVKENQILNKIKTKGQQTFDINGGQKTIITAKAGTILQIPANCFITPSGETETKNIKLSLIEVYDMTSYRSLKLPKTPPKKEYFSIKAISLEAQNAKGEELTIAPNKRILTYLNSSSSESFIKTLKEGKKAQTFYLDTEKIIG